MNMYNTKEFFESIKSLENKDLYFSGSEYSWASSDELDDDYGDFVCTYDDFVDAVNDYVAGDNKSLCRMIQTNGADIVDVNKMISNEPDTVDLEEID